MAAVRVQEAASHRLDEIYRYTLGLFEAFDRISVRGVVSRPVPAEFAVDGYVFRYERHLVYWRHLSTATSGS